MKRTITVATQNGQRTVVVRQSKARTHAEGTTQKYSLQTIEGAMLALMFVHDDGQHKKVAVDLVKGSYYDNKTVAETKSFVTEEKAFAYAVEQTAKRREFH